MALTFHDLLQSHLQRVHFPLSRHSLASSLHMVDCKSYRTAHNNIQMYMYNVHALLLTSLSTLVLHDDPIINSHMPVKIYMYIHVHCTYKCITITRHHTSICSDSSNIIVFQEDHTVSVLNHRTA